MDCGKHKISQAEQAITGKVSKVLNFPAGDLQDKTMPSCTSTSNDLDSLTKLIKEKYTVSSKQKKIQLPTLAPESWTIRRTAEEFGATEYLVRKA